MNTKTLNKEVLKDTDNYEGFMSNTNSEFQLLIKNKAVKSFARAEAASKPVKLDLLLTKLYLAL
jgi:phosphotransferase system IIB component